jgi:hypothetical protein
MLMQCIKLKRKGFHLKLQEFAAEPIARAAQPAAFARLVNGAVGQLIQVPRRRDRRFTSE